MSARAAAIQAIYAQVGAPDWAAPNLDGLADVLRDLSWLPDGAVQLSTGHLHGLDPDDGRALFTVLHRMVRETADSPHPVRLEP